MWLSPAPVPLCFRVRDLEQALPQSFTADTVKTVKVSCHGLLSDLHADSEYRAHLVSVIAGRTVSHAFDEGTSHD